MDGAIKLSSPLCEGKRFIIYYENLCLLSQPLAPFTHTHRKKVSVIKKDIMWHLMSTKGIVLFGSQHSPSHFRVNHLKEPHQINYSLVILPASRPRKGKKRILYDHFLLPVYHVSLVRYFICFRYLTWYIKHHEKKL